MTSGIRTTFQRVFFVGDFIWPWYDAAMAGAIAELGPEVARFSWTRYFNAVPGPLRRASRRFLTGPILWQVNQALRKQARAFRPDLIVIQRGVTVWASTVRALQKDTHAVVASINQDDPLAPLGSRLEWRHFRKAIPYYNVHFVCRPVNVQEFRALGARAIHVLRQYYVPALHHPEALSEQERLRWGAPVVFIGHCEDDGRLEYLDRLLEADVPIKVWGPGWNRRALTGHRCARLLPIAPVVGDEYRKAVAAAQVALCFFSRVNRDEVTTRCFEITAIGSLLLAQRTAAMQDLFREGKEADYFSSPDELAAKARHYLSHEDHRRQVAQAGHRRCLADGHDVKSRMQAMLAAAAECR